MTTQHTQHNTTATSLVASAESQYQKAGEDAQRQFRYKLPPDAAGQESPLTTQFNNEIKDTFAKLYSGYGEDAAVLSVEAQKYLQERREFYLNEVKKQNLPVGVQVQIEQVFGNTIEAFTKYQQDVATVTQKVNAIETTEAFLALLHKGSSAHTNQKAAAIYNWGETKSDKLVRTLGKEQFDAIKEKYSLLSKEEKHQLLQAGLTAADNNNPASTGYAFNRLVAYLNNGEFPDITFKARAQEVSLYSQLPEGKGLKLAVDKAHSFSLTYKAKYEQDPSEQNLVAYAEALRIESATLASNADHDFKSGYAIRTIRYELEALNKKHPSDYLRTQIEESFLKETYSFSRRQDLAEKEVARSIAELKVSSPASYQELEKQANAQVTDNHKNQAQRIGTYVLGLTKTYSDMSGKQLGVVGGATVAGAVIGGIAGNVPGALVGAGVGATVSSIGVGSYNVLSNPTIATNAYQTGLDPYDGNTLAAVLGTAALVGDVVGASALVKAGLLGRLGTRLLGAGDRAFAKMFGEMPMPELAFATASGEVIPESVLAKVPSGVGNMAMGTRAASALSNTYFAKEAKSGIFFDKRELESGFVDGLRTANNMEIAQVAAKKGIPPEQVIQGLYAELTIRNEKMVKEITRSMRKIVKLTSEDTSRTVINKRASTLQKIHNIVVQERFDNEAFEKLSKTYLDTIPINSSERGEIEELFRVIDQRGQSFYIINLRKHLLEIDFPEAIHSQAVTNMIIKSKK